MQTICHRFVPLGPHAEIAVAKRLNRLASSSRTSCAAIEPHRSRNMEVLNNISNVGSREVVDHFVELLLGLVRTVLGELGLESY